MRRVLTVAAITFGTVFVLSIIVFGRSRTDALEPASTATSFTAHPEPDVAGDTMAGKRIALADLRGKPVVVNFFAHWCQPCKQEAGQIAQTAADYRGRIHMISIARDSTRFGVQAFATRYGMTWPILWDGSDDLSRAFKVPGQPVTFIIDANGRIVDEVTGQTTEQRIASTLNRLVSS
ncbi:MAG: TlpA family protein disulfide reductase [Gaiellales bacterium]|jgi:peroxiredoxin